MDTPIGFDVALDGDLFSLDRLDALYRKGVESANAGAQDADPGVERREDPPVVRLQRPLGEAVSERELQVWFRNVLEWAPEYRESSDRVLEAAAVDRSQQFFHFEVNIRVFSPEGPVALHADPETQLNVGLGGTNRWHFSWPSGLSQEEHENLLHGGHFLPWRDLEIWKTYELHAGQGCGAPPRWPHWIEHPGPDPAVSFEIGYFTADDVRDRKVWDVNWMLRKSRLVSPRPPRESQRKDRLKHRAFDAISMVTRRGSEFRGV